MKYYNKGKALKPPHLGELFSLSQFYYIVYIKAAVLQTPLSVTGLMKGLPGAVIPLLRDIQNHYFSEHNGDVPSANLPLRLKMFHLNDHHVAAQDPPFHKAF